MAGEARPQVSNNSPPYCNNSLLQFNSPPHPNSLPCNNSPLYCNCPTVTHLL
uniref:Uncharacterized protein n=1 Tax=Arion vulgaris TaxID=1028688 RepID=A0A0B7AEX7_9EUPU